MKGLKKLALIALAAAAVGWTAPAQAAPILPKPFMFYTSNRMIAFRQIMGFHMYFNSWRGVAPTWGALNINFMAGLHMDRTKTNLPLPAPWKIAKDNRATGGWVSPANPYRNTWPNQVPEPTGIAAIAGAGLLLGRRKREA